VTRALIIAAILFVPTSVCALDIGARLPIKYGEIFMVRNDGGIEQTLLVVDFGVEITRLSCPHETETNMRYAQARKRYEDYVRALDDKFFSDLNGGN